MRIDISWTQISSERATGYVEIPDDTPQSQWEEAVRSALGNDDYQINSARFIECDEILLDSIDIHTEP